VLHDTDIVLPNRLGQVVSSTNLCAATHTYVFSDRQSTTRTDMVPTRTAEAFHRPPSTGQNKHYQSIVFVVYHTETNVSTERKWRHRRAGARDCSR